MNTYLKKAGEKEDNRRQHPAGTTSASKKTNNENPAATPADVKKTSKEAVNIPKKSRREDTY